jgi:hypothetical protein
MIVENNAELNLISNGLMVGRTIMEYVEGKKPQPAHIAYKDWQLPI